VQVVLTRPVAQSRAWADALLAAGHRVLHLPLLTIAGLDAVAAGQSASVQSLQAELFKAQNDTLCGGHGLHALMFVSSNAVEHFFTENKTNVSVILTHNAILNIVNSQRIRCWATGPGTVAALLVAGVQADLIDAPDAQAAQFDAEHLWAVVKSQVATGMRLLIVRGAALQPDGRVVATGRDWLALAAQAAGAQVQQVASYLRCPPVWSVEQRAQAMLAADTDTQALWLFSSSEALAHLPMLLPQANWAAAHCVATHPRIADAARALGFAVVCTSRPALDEVLVSIKSLQ
jgi:uroporphyrinogen-III synthase